MTADELEKLVSRLAGSSAGRTEADIQADVRSLLLSGAFGLEDSNLDLKAPSLESQVGDGTRRRIDIEAGFCVVEVKRNLTPAVVDEAVSVQLPGYVRTREQQTGARYTGLLTDGRRWKLFRLKDDVLVEVREMILDANNLDVDRLLVWIEAIFATKQGVPATPETVSETLGATSPGFALDSGTLSDIYESVKDEPEIRLKRDLWAKSLATAFGEQFDNSDELFVNHTYLVTVAELVAHVALEMGLDASEADLVGGEVFRTAGYRNVVEEDFFDWVVASEDEIQLQRGCQFVRELGRRVERFEWEDVNQDILKSLYESVISPETRHKLGEYYTADWLAQEIVAESVDEPLEQRVLDPSCGSGTFLFAAIRRIKEAAKEAKWDRPKTFNHIVTNVIGVDLHPVAVTLARVTYMLALGKEMKGVQPPTGTTIPVFLGDSLQWDRTDQTTLFSTEGLVIATNDGLELFAGELRFPNAILSDIQLFDSLVADLARRATNRRRGTKPRKLTNAFLKKFKVPDEDFETVRTTFKTMCSLHDNHRDHIWSYYVRNLARPLWLALEENRVDVLVGNPPWVAYRHLPNRLQADFKTRAKQLGIKPPQKLITHSDLSAYFVVSATDSFLKKDGKFAFVMPRGVLGGPHYTDFRSGAYPPNTHRSVTFTKTWDMVSVRPHLFPVPSCVIFGEKTKQPGPMPDDTTTWVGDATNFGAMTRSQAKVVRADHPESPYHDLAKQGAILSPRYLILVTEGEAGGLGAPAGTTPVISRRKNDKDPWAKFESLKGNIETQFIHPVLLGQDTAPYLILGHQQAVLALHGGELLDPSDPALDNFGGLAGWWRESNRVWDAHSSGKMSLSEQINYLSKLTDQIPTPPIRVVYATSGTLMSAVIVQDQKLLIESSMYSIPVDTIEEGQYLTAVLNSPAYLDMFSGLQPHGQYGTRHFHRYPFYPHLPKFDPTSDQHNELAAHGRAAAALANATLDNTLKERPAAGVQIIRRRVRDGLSQSELGDSIDSAVNNLLAASPEPKQKP